MKRKKFEPLNPIILKRLKEKHGFSSRFIYMSIRGERTSESSVKIVDDYKNMTVELNKIIEKL